MPEGTISGLLLKDASHSVMEETLPEPLGLLVLMREDNDLDSGKDSVICCVIDRFLVPSSS